MRGNRSNSHRTRNSIGERNERPRGRDDSENAITREIAHEEPLDARSGEKSLLEGKKGKRGNGEVLDLGKRNRVGLEVLISVFDGGSGGMKERLMSEWASKQASKQANKQANKQASKQANKQANKQASKQANKQSHTHSKDMGRGGRKCWRE